MGSTSDLPIMEKAAMRLDALGIPFEMLALSAHRTPREVEAFATSAKERGIRVIIAGLDLDFRRKPFGPMADLCAIADSVDKLHAICMECGHWANYSYRLVLGEQQVMLGEATEYSPLCRTCYLKHLNTTTEK